MTFICTGCLFGLGTKVEVDDFGPKHLFAVFSISLVAVVGTFGSYFMLQFCIHSRSLSSLFSNPSHQDV